MKTLNNQNDRYIRMTTEPVSKLITSLATPTIMSMLVSAFYNTADTYFVGKINTSATGAVGIVFSLMIIIQVVGIMIGVGSGSYIARLLGKRQADRASRATSTAFFMVIAWGIGLAVLGEIFLDPFMRLLGSTETILPYAKSYGGIILLGAPYMAASFVMNTNLRSEGNALLAMIGIVSGAVVNIILDPIFIFGFRMGIAGAATATIISQLISFLILLSHYIRRRSTLRIHPGNILFEKEMFREILGSGLPSFFRQSVAILAAIILNTSAGVYGDAAVAGMSVVNRIILFLGSALIGFGQGFQPVAAFNFAAGFGRRVYDAFWFAVKTGTVFLLVFSTVACIFAPQIIKLFRNDPEVIRIGALALRLQCVTFPFSAFIVMSNMMFQYIGKPAKASLLALSRQGLVFIPVIMILSQVLGLRGIQMSQALSDGTTFLIAVPLTAGTLKVLKNSDLLHETGEIPGRGSLRDCTQNA
ncbi:MATE family efflux transporter [Marispirochaeta aestuarii]|uniref:MATE family efflux transporter n=1 Tax=Marispirochaeta aestuarii TaxID=1963862 RepID=UPI0029C66062|nr:MATE family efflux transporter [Marispirochaeta aestuarii]